MTTNAPGMEIPCIWFCILPERTARPPVPRDLNARQWVAFLSDATSPEARGYWRPLQAAMSRNERGRPPLRTSVSPDSRHRPCCRRPVRGCPGAAARLDARCEEAAEGAGSLVLRQHRGVVCVDDAHGVLAAAVADRARAGVEDEIHIGRSKVCLGAESARVGMAVGEGVGAEAGS
jgi:hypothetical protein